MRRRKAGSRGFSERNSGIFPDPSTNGRQSGWRLVPSPWRSPAWVTGSLALGRQGIEAGGNDGLDGAGQLDAGLVFDHDAAG